MAGRPKIKLSDLPKNWEKLIIDLSKQGASIIELSVALDISRDTFYALIERENQFSDTIKRCKQYCEAWWIAKGRTELENKEFSYTGWYMNMKNRFGWTDRSDITTQGDKVEASKETILTTETINKLIDKL